MSKSAEELRTERNKLISDQRKMLDSAERENRELRSFEEQKYALMDEEIDRLDEQIRTVEEGPRHRVEPDDDGRTEPLILGGDEIRVFPPGTPVPSGAWRKCDRAERRELYDLLNKGPFGLSATQRKNLEQRAMAADTDVGGGFWIAPEQFQRQILAKLQDEVFIRRYATQVQCRNARSLGAGAMDTEPADADWTSEIQSIPEETDMNAEKRSWHPHDLSKMVKVSRKFVRLSPDGGTFVRDRLAYKFGITEEKAFLTGDGAAKPLGLMTASSDGISTSRDTSTSVAGTIKCDDFVDCFMALKAQYRRNGRWMLSRDALRVARKLKDGEGDYLWQPGLAGNRPDSILGRPYTESEFIDDVSSGNYVAICGDFSFYWIVDELTMEIQTLTELFARTSQIAYIGRKSTDGMPVFQEAFQRLKVS